MLNFGNLVGIGGFVGDTRDFGARIEEALGALGKVASLPVTAVGIVIDDSNFAGLIGKLLRTLNINNEEDLIDYVTSVLGDYNIIPKDQLVDLIKKEYHDYLDISGDEETYPEDECEDDDYGYPEEDYDNECDDEISDEESSEVTFGLTTENTKVAIESEESFPTYNIYEEFDGDQLAFLKIEMAIPGFDENSIEVHWDGDENTLSVDFKEQGDQGYRDRQYLLRENVSNPSPAILNIEGPYDFESMEAKMINEFTLCITIPAVAVEDSNSRVVTVKPF